MSKISADHLSKRAYVYIRQSTLEQVHKNIESQRRQYALADRARELGWQDVEVIDDDLGRSGGGIKRPGFERLLVRRFNGAESDAHSVRSRIRHEPEGNECRSAMVNPHANLSSPRKRRCRLDKTAKDAQIARVRDHLPFGFHVHDFRPGREGMAHRAMLFHLHS